MSEQECNAAPQRASVSNSVGTRRQWLRKKTGLEDRLSSAAVAGAQSTATSSAAKRNSGAQLGALMARPAALPNCLHGVPSTAAACQRKPAPPVHATAMRPGRRPGWDALLAELSHGQHKWLVRSMYQYLGQTPLGCFPWPRSVDRHQEAPHTISESLH